MARFAAVVHLPSPGTELVTTKLRGPKSKFRNCRFVRSVRNDSARGLRGWSAENSLTSARLHSMTFSDGSGQTRNGGVASPHAPTPGIGKQWIHLVKSATQGPIAAAT